ncbi:MAG: hypothetical protein ABH846_00220 [Patescibacteria group bacterium]
MPVVVRRGMRRGRRPIMVAPMRLMARPARRRRPRWIVGLILLIAVAAIVYLVFRLMK